ncbi:MAG: hypothetical protein QOJ43_1944, partial [Gaiellaceae bacterium]|nr:hypothetical protein [Gaiellaceae bacterium]
MRRFLLPAAVLAALVAAPAAPAWTWPVQGPVLRPFLLGPDAYAGGQHRGVDVGAPVGASVVAPAAGLVSFVGSVPGGGRALTIQTADGYAITLLQFGAVVVARGTELAEGAVAGTVGESADDVTTAPHVHLGVRVASEPNGYVDPLSLLPHPAPAPPAGAPAPAAPAPPPVAAPASVAPGASDAPAPAVAANGAPLVETEAVPVPAAALDPVPVTAVVPHLQARRREPVQGRAPVPVAPAVVVGPALAPAPARATAKWRPAARVAASRPLRARPTPTRSISAARPRTPAPRPETGSPLPRIG